MLPVPKSILLLARNKKDVSDDDSVDDDEGEQAEEIELSDEEDEDDYDLEPVFAADVRGRPAGVVIEDLSWRVEKLRLEEANKRRFLKAGPRFLPYDECKKWVQAWGNRWTSAQEWCVCLEPASKQTTILLSFSNELREKSSSL